MHGNQSSSGLVIEAGSDVNTGLVSLPAQPGTLAEFRVVLPEILISAGDAAVTRFAEFFTVNIENPNTRRAYFRNAISFLQWCEDRGLRSLKSIKPMMIAGFVQHLLLLYQFGSRHKPFDFLQL